MKIPFRIAAAVLLGSAPTQHSAAATPPESIVVTASPLPGSTLDPDKLPVTVEVISPQDIARFGSPDLLRALANAPGVSFSEAQDNPFQPNVFFRGFEASPLAGDAQGIAVYAGGVRLNHPFGDTVDWDLIPENAISSLTIESTNPVFGLNALGGSMAMQFRNGFDFNGARLSGSGGSFGRVEGGFQSGIQDGGSAFYAAGEARSESGWRQHSPSNLYRVFADFDRRGPEWRVQLDLLGARSDLTGNGVSPVELLQASRAAVFTYPDSTKNAFALANLEGTIALSDSISFSGNLYVSRFDQHTLNGDAGAVDRCDGDPALLCLDNGEVATAVNDQPIQAFPVELTYGQLNRTSTGTTGFGGSAEASLNTRILGQSGQWIAGAAWDGGRTRFSADTAVGSLSLDRGFAGPGIIIDQSDGVVAPVSIDSRNDYYGIYVSARMDISDALSVTLSGRYNLAEIALTDLRGAALSGRHAYTHLNPAAGLTYAIDPHWSIYGGYSEANRAPTPAEFSCAGENTSCTLTNFFVADPDLKQVVAQNAEAGLRGSADIPGISMLHWRMDFFRSELHNDIQFVASQIIGRGFFENIGATRREGTEFALDAAGDSWSLSLDYSFTRATFRTPLTLNSPDNPLAGINGQIAVTPGDRLPGIPTHLGKAVLETHVTGDFDITVALRAASGTYLRGDEANLNPKIPGYAVVDLGARYRISERFTLFGLVSNIFDAKYATFGAFSPTSEVPLVEARGATNPRSLSPAAPRWFSAGVTIGL